MAPTKKRSSTKSTTTKVKTKVKVKTTNGSSSGKKNPLPIKVMRRPATTTKPNTKKKKTIVVPELPNDWPVSSRRQVFPMNASALAPGTLLQNHCNGQDIHLARNAVGRPNLTKEKGKYLIILPGNLSLKSAATATTTATKNNVIKNNNTNSNDNENDDDEEENNNNNNNKQQQDLSQSSNKSNSNTTTTTTTTTTSFGKINDLDTDNPKLVVPFSSSSTNKLLIFPGKKIELTTKYIMLSCSTKKNGSVACKVSFFFVCIVYIVLRFNFFLSHLLTYIIIIIIFIIIEYIFFCNYIWTTNMEERRRRKKRRW